MSTIRRDTGLDREEPAALVNREHEALSGPAKEVSVVRCPLASPYLGCDVVRCDTHTHTHTHTHVNTSVCAASSVSRSLSVLVRRKNTGPEF